MKKEEKKKLKKLYIIIAIIIFSIIFIDQLTKIIVLNYEEINIGNVVLKANPISAGMYDETSRGVTILTNLVIVFIIFGIIKSDNQFVSKKTKILLSFALAGGISNIIDRICRGSVVEFINISPLPAFNIADVCILIGWISFVAIFAAFSSKELQKKKESKEDVSKERTRNKWNILK